MLIRDDARADARPDARPLPLLSVSGSSIVRENIPPRLFGTNIVYSWESDAYWNGTGPGDAAQALNYAGNAFLRFPGGEVTSYWHWSAPVGRGWSDSWSPAFNGNYEPSDNWMSYDEYFQYLGNSLPLVGVNMASGWKYGRDGDGLDEAEALALHTASKVAAGEWPEVAYWFLDNEQHLEKFNDTGGWSEDLYASYINMYAPRIRAHVPNAKFVANWKHGASSWDQLLSGAGSNIDMMDVHSYWHRNGWATTDWQSYLDGTGADIQSPYGSSYRQWIQGIKDVGGAREVSLFEWGLSPSPETSPPLSRLQTAFMSRNTAIARFSTKTTNPRRSGSSCSSSRVSKGIICCSRALTQRKLACLLLKANLVIS